MFTYFQNMRYIQTNGRFWTSLNLITNEDFRCLWVKVVCWSYLIVNKIKWSILCIFLISHLCISNSRSYSGYIIAPTLMQQSNNTASGCKPIIELSPYIIGYQRRAILKQDLIPIQPAFAHYCTIIHTRFEESRRRVQTNYWITMAQLCRSENRRIQPLMWHFSLLAGASATPLYIS